MVRKSLLLNSDIYFFFYYYLGDFLLKQRHPIVMLICLYLKNLVHLFYYYQYLELPVVWIPQAKNSLLLLVEKSESSTTNCQKSFLNVIMLGSKGFLGHHTSPVTFMCWWCLSYLSCCCWSSCSMMFVLVLYSWICYPFLWLTSMMPGNIFYAFHLIHFLQVQLQHYNCFKNKDHCINLLDFK